MTPAPHAPPLLLAVARLVANQVGTTFLPIGSAFSIASLVCALTVAVAVTAAARRRRGRTVTSRFLLRALFPRRLFGRSGRADAGFFVLNVLVAGMLLGAAILSGEAVSHGTAARLSALWGEAPLRHAPAWASGALTTVLLFAAYEFGYYADHWLSHRVPALWELHKPHHTAETLTPLTNFRVHPLESLKFLNILALTIGGTGGLCAAVFGPGHEAELGGRNILFLGFWFAIGHLQHTGLWITLPGPLARWVISPAHHQIHHSADPRHFGKNLGSFLSVFDRLFGTLAEPHAGREALVFGVEGHAARHHGVAGALIDPVANAWAVLRGKPRGAPAAGDVS